jgi:hypothetical protein
MTINSTLYALRSTLLISAKSFVLLFCFGFMGNNAFAQTANNSIDATGDIAFTAYSTNATNTLSAFAFVLLDNCPNNQSIGFTDDEWTGSSFVTLSSGLLEEGQIIWTNNTGATINKGTVIKIAASAINTAWPSASVSIGSIALTGSFTTGNGDQIFAMTGNRNSYGTFLAFVGGITNSTLYFQGTPFGTGGNPTSNLVFNGTYGTNVTAGSAYTNTATCNGTVAQCNTMINTAASWSSPGTFANAAAFFANTPIPNSFTGSVLPIELTAFDVQNTEGSKNHLTWTTASEVNNKHFDIERSTDGTTFHNIGQVRGNNKPSTYQFVDNQPFATSYYRLKQVDFDGTETYSKVVSVEQKGKGKGLKIYPTVVSNGILTVDTEGGDVQIFNLLGQQVLNHATSASSYRMTSTSPTLINISALPQGTYVLKVGTEVAKFVKQ